MRKPGAKARIRQFFLANIGNVVTSMQLRDAAGPEATAWGRRVRELREQDGWPILTQYDSAQLSSGQYLLKEQPPEQPAVAFVRGVSTKLRAEVLDRNDFTCQMCGVTPGDVDPATGRKV